MRPLTAAAFQSLLAEHAAPCVSLYMPTEHGPNSLPANRVRFRDLLDKAETQLAKAHTKRELAPVIEPLRELSTDAFWFEQRAGLAAFGSRKFQTFFNLTSKVAEQVVVSDSFHVRPLLAQLQSNRHFYLLNLSHHHVGLYRGSLDGLAPVALEGAPTSVEAAVGAKERPRVTTHHSGGPANRGSSIVHSGLGDRHPEEAELQQFLRAVDAALYAELAEEKAPLLLAMPREILPEFRRISRYPRLMAGELHGNFERMAASELFERALPLARAEFDRRTNDLVASYGSQAARGRATADVSEIARFAVQGRIRELFLALGESLPGRFDRATGALELQARGEVQRGDDTLDDIAEAVLMRGGEVLALERAAMPAAGPIAALLRW